uniref:thioredoxin-disulfide reductase (NADPH) n=1 Tax=Caenorhabditis japonica TaxID=281687 RepID=A0A8R1DHW7_CAEJA
MGAVASRMPARSVRSARGGEPANKKRLHDESEHSIIPEENSAISQKEALRKAAAAKVAIIFSGSEQKQENLEFFKEVEKIIKEATPLPDENSSETSPPPLQIEKLQVSQSVEKSIKIVNLFDSFPQIYIKGNAIGGLNELKSLKIEYLREWLRPHQYDLIVIGGGSGGLAAAKEAARLGKKVACLDYVKPSPVGTTWGLGGTCVNVGCIPKKLMHQASLLGHSLHDAKKFGWKLPDGQIEHRWTHLKDSVQDHIASLNWGYRVQLREKTVTYFNSYGEFSGPFEISATNKKKKVEKLTADRFLISTGLRPKYPEIPGAKEFTITSDDLFQLPYSPGKTLCVGASYVSLECAGFLHGLGYDVTVMVRSILLRGFDQDMAEKIRKHMKAYGLKFESGVPSKIEQITEKTDEKAGLYRVFWQKKDEKSGNLTEVSEDYNTILMAIGREAMTDDMGLEAIGVKRAKSKKIIGRREQSETIPWIYAIGDVLEGTPELTPVAIQAGRVLMRRLINGTDELTEYDQIPTTVFTPLEYGCCGLSEEDAITRYGKESIIVYHNVFNPLEYTIPERMDKDHCYLKLICLRNEEEKVVGFHILSPNAGEITQGFGIALKLSAKKSDFDRLIGIHPTVAESFTTLTLEKKDGDEELQASGCC